MKKGKRIIQAACACICLILLAGTVRAEGKKERLPDRTLMSFYESSLFVGDSQVRNLGNYIRKQRRNDPDFFSGVKCFGAYSLQMKMLARKSPSSNAKDVQLSYNGRNATLTGIAAAENPRSVFILIGMNDIIYDHIDRADRYIDQILLLRDEYYPRTKIFFLSLTPVTNQRKQHARDNINAYNIWLEEKCTQAGAEYMDVTAGLTDSEGWMPKEITSDSDCHFNDRGFEIFIRNLLDYAQSRYEAGLWDPEDK